MFNVVEQVLGEVVLSSRAPIVSEAQIRDLV